MLGVKKTKKHKSYRKELNRIRKMMVENGGEFEAAAANLSAGINFLESAYSFMTRSKLPKGVRIINIHFEATNDKGDALLQTVILLQKALDSYLSSHKTLQEFEAQNEGCVCIQDSHDKKCPAIKTGKCHYQNYYRKPSVQIKSR